MYEHCPFSLQVTATDIDGPGQVFGDNGTRIKVDTGTGWINLTPKASDIGVHVINITVTDGSGGWDWKDVTFDVRNTNDPPVIEPVGKQVAYEDQPFHLKIIATDPDLPFNDTLTFEDDCPLFEIHSETGEIDFTPVVPHVGTYQVTVTVRDSEGEEAFTVFTLEVLHVNHPPSGAIILTPNEGEEVIQGNSTTFRADPTFDKDQDQLTYTWFLGDEKIDEGIPFGKNLTAEPGNYTVKLVVRDGVYSVEDTVNISILEPPPPPEPPKKPKPKHDSWLPGFEAGVVCVALTILIMLRRRRS